MRHKTYFCLLVLPIFAFTGTASAVQRQKLNDATRHLEQARSLIVSAPIQAEKEFKLAIEGRNGHYPEALEELAWLLAKQLRFDEAASIYAKYLELSPNRFQKEGRKILKEFHRAVYLAVSISQTERPTEKELLEYTHIIYRNAQSAQPALPYAEKAVNLYPQSSMAYMTLGDLMVRSEQGIKGETFLLKAIELDPQNAEAYYHLGIYYSWWKPNSIRESVVEFQKAIEVSKGEFSQGWFGLGRALSSLGKKDEARNALQNYINSGKATGYEHAEAQNLLRQLK